MNARNAVFLVGLALFGGGAAWLSVPWALISTGVILMASALAGHFINRGGKT